MLLYLLPADPARQIAGRSATPADDRQHPRQLGLDRRSRQQYCHYFGGLLHGDLGRSYMQRTEVATLIAAACRPPCC